MAEKKSTTSNKSKIVEKPSQKSPSSKESEKKLNPKQEDLSQIISSTISETMKAMQSNLNQQAQTSEMSKSDKEKVISRINKTYDRRVNENKRFLQRLANAPESDYRYISIPRVYAKYLGSNIPVSINGSVITIPVNGKRYKVHKYYVPIIRQRIEYEDEKISYMDQTDFSDVLEVDHGDLGQ